MPGRKNRAAQTIPTARAPRSVARSSWSGRSMARRVSYPIRSMSNRGVGMRRAHAVRVRQGLLPPKTAGSPGFAAALSGLLPGLGQAYQGRWVRGILMVLLPIFAVLLAGTFIAIADPLTSLVLRNAPAFTFVVAGCLLTYHLYVVADAFAGKLRGIGALRGRHLAEYLVLAVVCASLVAFYGTLYRGSAPWASLAAKIFEPIARQPLIANAQEPLVSWSGTERLNVLLLGVVSHGGLRDRADRVPLRAAAQERGHRHPLRPIAARPQRLQPREPTGGGPHRAAGADRAGRSPAAAPGHRGSRRELREDELRPREHPAARAVRDGHRRLGDPQRGPLPVRRRLRALRAPLHRRRRRLLPCPGRREGPRARGTALLRPAGEGRGRLGRGPGRGRRAGGRAERRRSARRAGLHGHERVERAGGALGGVRAHRREALHR